MKQNNFFICLEKETVEDCLNNHSENGYELIEMALNDASSRLDVDVKFSIIDQYGKLYGKYRISEERLVVKTKFRVA